MPLLQYYFKLQTFSRNPAHHKTTETPPCANAAIKPLILLSTLFLLTSANAENPPGALQPQPDTTTTLMGSRAFHAEQADSESSQSLVKKISPPAWVPGYDRMTSLAEPLPNDAYAKLQWNLMPNDQYAGGANVFNTPQHNRNQTQIVVAVVDSGVLLDHEDYTTLPGYDFVHDPMVGNDGDGRDNDPTDPGDWVNETDISLKRVTTNCQITNSKWHGTAIAGIIGAHSENQLGVAGGSAFASLLPVRITGKCGGYVNDLIDGIRWAAGLPVAGVPDNPYPARIINLSVGFPGSCSSRLQSTIDDATNAGAILIAAATNNSVSLDQQPYSPASCKNILAVGAILRDGLLANYSAWGNDVFILGPGGASYDGIISTDNAGLEQAETDGNYGYHFGTSLAAAHVSAALATLLSIEPALDNASLKNLLIQSATPITNDPQCKSNGCGHGKLNANRAVRLLLNPDTSITTIKNTVTANDPPTGTDPDLAAAREPEVVGLGKTGLSFVLPLMIAASSRRRLQQKSP